ncbi:MAG: hypothetical protein B0D92_01470 [Spirochaeta sp. LUC14_002_19_P3]|nr:MAG: hypothetical protein B0D92_01470 [Spirochaeta sp. LUC14_002_19_P3]
MDGGELSKFRRCVNRARLRRIPSVRFVAVPLPLAAAVLAVLLVLTVLNFMPIERRFPQSARLQRNIYPTTVVSLSLTPNDVENLIHLMEGRQGFDGHATTYVLPAELPVAWLGNPQVQNAAVHENKP